MTKTKIKRGDTKTAFSESLGVDLTGATVKFQMRSEDGVLIRQDAAVTAPATSGAVTYQPVADDVKFTGQFRQEWEVTFVDGKVQSFPVDGYNEVTIIEDLNPP